MFPEGTRSPDGSLRPFKSGVGLFSQKTNTPVLFLYLRKIELCGQKARVFLYLEKCTFMWGRCRNQVTQILFLIIIKNGQ